MVTDEWSEYLVEVAVGKLVAKVTGNAPLSVAPHPSGDERRAWLAKMPDGSREIIVELREAP